MKDDKKYKNVKNTINQLIKNGKEISITNISNLLGITKQGFYISYKDYLDYVNNVIYMSKVESIELKIKSYQPNYKLVEYSTISNKLRKHLIQCDNNNHEPFYSTITGKTLICPLCKDEARSKKGLLKAQELAKSKGGVCLSTEYKNQLSKLTFHCGNSRHKPWTTTFLNNLYYNSWCPECGRSQLNKKKG